MIYDMRKGMQKNPRRVEFTKGLYGFNYSWDTKSGRKHQRKEGLLEILHSYDKVGESAILMQDEDFDKLKAYFQSYSDVIVARAFKIAHELSLYDINVEHIRKSFLVQEDNKR